jgi:hypothetical protein
MSEPERIRYRFDLPDGSKKTFDFFFDPVSFRLTNAPPANPPFWTKLGFNQCANCPLKAELQPHCPAALQMVRGIDELKALVSHDTVNVSVFQDERRVSVVTTAQTALSSVFGLIMATSGCPWTDHLRPMARFHLPFASDAETVYRSVSMYALARIAWGGKKLEASSFGPLQELYGQLHVVNRDMSRRLGAAAQTDPARNAIALLDALATLLPDALEKSLQEIAPLFTAWSKAPGESI